MCGIAGALALVPQADPGPLVRRMLARLRHRGPDGDALYTRAGAAIGLCRLAVTAPSEAAAVFQAGTVAAVTNGEIDNHADLRVRLAGRAPVSRVDTAVIPALYAAEGPRFAALLRGMFAAIVDDGAALHLFRDPLGKKPLFWRVTSSFVLVASEQRALFVTDAPAVDPARAARCFVRGFLDDDEPLFAGVHAVPPGAHVTLRRDAGVHVAHVAPLVDGSDALADRPVTLDQLEAAFARAVERRLRPDVAGATLLSGGIDSGLVAAAAGLPCATVDVPGRSEARTAAARARALGLPHDVVPAAPPSRVRLRRALAHLEVPDVGAAWELGPALMDLAQSLATDGVKVAFTGEGADEAFVGYPWQRASLAISRRLPKGTRLEAEVTGLLFAFARERLAAPRARAIEHWRRAVEARTVRDAQDACAALLPDANPLDDDDAPTRSAPHPERALQLDALERDMLSLPILHADRLLMAHGVEARLPFLDVDLVRLALHAPPALLAGRHAKPAVRALAQRRLPGPIAEKRGFAGRARPPDDDVHQWVRDGLAQGTRVVNGAALRGLVERGASAALLWRAILLEETAAVMSTDNRDERASGWAR